LLVNDSSNKLGKTLNNLNMDPSTSGTFLLAGRRNSQVCFFFKKKRKEKKRKEKKRKERKEKKKTKI